MVAGAGPFGPGQYLSVNMSPRPLESEQFRVGRVLAILADEWTIKGSPTDVLVDAPRGVKDWLLRQPAALSAADVIAICATAAKPATWVAQAS